MWKPGGIYGYGGLSKNRLWNVPIINFGTPNNKYNKKLIVKIPLGRKGPQTQKQRLPSSKVDHKSPVRVLSIFISQQSQRESKKHPGYGYGYETYEMQIAEVVWKSGGTQVGDSAPNLVI